MMRSISKVPLVPMLVIYSLITVNASATNQRFKSMGIAMFLRVQTFLHFLPRVKSLPNSRARITSVPKSLKQVYIV